jgi:hypothetical protein
MHCGEENVKQLTLFFCQTETPQLKPFVTHSTYVRRRLARFFDSQKVSVRIGQNEGTHKGRITYIYGQKHAAHGGEIWVENFEHSNFELRFFLYLDKNSSPRGF